MSYSAPGDSELSVIEQSNAEKKRVLKAVKAEIENKRDQAIQLARGNTTSRMSLQSLAGTGLTSRTYGCDQTASSSTGGPEEDPGHGIGAGEDQGDLSS